MSKISGLPTQKGTQLFPKVTQAPTKLVVRGVPTGTALYRHVVAAFEGQLKQFHGKQRQNYALSSNPVMKTRTDWGNARATYTNLSGQETLELEVDRNVLEELSKTVQETDNWPDFAVVDFVIRNPFNNPFSFMAALIRPEHRRIAPTLVEPYEPYSNEFDVAGVSGDYSQQVVGDKPLLEFARASLSISEDPDTPATPITDYVASLKIDFRTLAPTDMVVVDIYARAFDYSVQEGELIGYSLGQMTSLRRVNTEHVTGYVYSDTNLIDSPSILSLYVPPEGTYQTIVAAYPQRQSGLSGQYTDYEGHTQYEEYIQTIWRNEAGVGGITTNDWEFIDPGNPYYAQGYRMRAPYAFDYCTEVLTYPKEPVYGGTIDVVDMLRTVDMTYCYYEPGTKLTASLINVDADGGAFIWTVNGGGIPSRSHFASLNIFDVGVTTFEQEDDGLEPPATPENPLQLPYKGQLVFARHERAVSWHPA